MSPRRSIGRNDARNAAPNPMRCGAAGVEARAGRRAPRVGSRRAAVGFGRVGRPPPLPVRLDSDGGLRLWRCSWRGPRSLLRGCGWTVRAIVVDKWRVSACWYHCHAPPTARSRREVTHATRPERADVRARPQRHPVGVGGAAGGPLGARAATVAWPTSTLVVSEVQTGGGSASDEFVEIANQGTAAGRPARSRGGLRDVVGLDRHPQGDLGGQPTAGRRAGGSCSRTRPGRMRPRQTWSTAAGSPRPAGRSRCASSAGA